MKTGSISPLVWRGLLLLAWAAGTLFISACGDVAATPSPVPLPPTATVTPAALPTSTSAPASANGEQTPTSAPATGSGAGSAGDTIKIGVDLNFADPDGPRMRDGVLLAIEQANAAGGVMIAGKTYKLDTEVLDDGVSPDLGAVNAAKLVADPAVLAVVGPYNSNVAQANMPIFNQAGLAQISPSNTNPVLTQPQYGVIATLRPTGKLTYFRTVAHDDIQGPGAADYMYDKLGARKIYIIDDTGDYGVRFADNLTRRFQERGGTVVARDSVTADTPDLEKILTKRVGTKPDMVVFAGTDGGDIVRRQTLKAGFTVPFLGSDGILRKQYTDDAGAAAEGNYATATGTNQAVFPEAQPFLASYKARFSEDPSLYTPNAYEATNIIIAAMKRAAAPDRESVRREIAATKNYKGILGTTSFDENGDTTNRWISIFRVKGGAWTFLDQINYQGTLP